MPKKKRQSRFLILLRKNRSSGSHRVSGNAGWAYQGGYTRAAGEDAVAGENVVSAGKNAAVIPNAARPKKRRGTFGPFHARYTTSAPERRPALFTRQRLLTLVGAGVCLFLLYFSVRSSAVSIAAGKRGLELCAGVVIPSLFPFFVFSGLAVRCGLIGAAGRFMAPAGRVLFRAPPSVTPVILMSMLSGSPVGASALCALLETGEIDKTECQRFLPLCSLASPAFILGSLAALLQNSTLALMLYAVHVGSNLLLGFLYSRAFPRQQGRRAQKRPAAPVREKFSQSFVLALKNAVTAILQVCGFVIIFCVIVAFLDASGIKGAACALGARLLPLDDGYALCAGLFDGFFEMSSACAGIATSSLSPVLKSALCAFSLSWLGLSIHCQIMTFTAGHGLRMGRYFAYKLVHALISAALVFPCFYLFPDTRAVFSPAAGAIVHPLSFPLARFSLSLVLTLCIVFLIMAILNLYTNSVKNR